MAKLQAIRGMNDILPEQTPSWQYLEKCFQQVMHRYAYQEIRFPILEQTALFKRSIGEVTDIVEKEMYSFDDRNGDNLSLRPEGTAGCVRAADQNGLLYNQQQRLWYQGPMFRHERPQKGRYRQFHQFGVEAFGMDGPDIDAEIIQLSASLWNELDLGEYLTLEINNIGSAEDRKSYGAALTSFLEERAESLDDDARKRMHTNPMRVLDSKNPDVQSALGDAPALEDYVNEQSIEHFSKLKALLDRVGITYVVNPRLVRGLDYYNNCVFEWITDSLGAQGTVCGGGRYDGLVAQLGGKPTKAAGFAIGEERLVLMLDSLSKVPAQSLQKTDVYIVVIGEEMSAAAMELSLQLRSSYPQLGIISHCGGGKYNSQLKRAFSSGAELAVVLESDSGEETVKLRRLDDSADSVSVNISEAVLKVGEILGISGS
ncbi:MAG: histidine--tRNA ligase [Gammaproteobacteria bacterium]|jgi:histidyl-tRNA synthetase|nr:histidine--tRNA ligase [Gammaproteobacteria bacterium]MBT3859085.1 histidine--tRNA ligase [Gammaproteobacteria bacterium]MBT3987085.1 histidine--tRNA ligase [Gammaproteobacteria bacterium]MBT4255226.1 histidine--tRNA ligase [Gammaproteobacteria bacterium]MBT4580650.1 histidine--tRNA ligase [Gammaproteobacteria bacterium]